jgi:hypothetical protein
LTLATGGWPSKRYSVQQNWLGVRPSFPWRSEQEGAQHGERQGQRHNQDAAEMHEEHNMRERDKDDLLDQRIA